MISLPTVVLRLGLAIVLGALVGLERESHDHTAGLRTNALVALGSALFMIISEYGFSSFLNTPHIQLDPSRIASYVVAGVGFLGGGAIIMSQEREKVKGLTTAAAIWIVAALGLACGAGMLLEAIVATALALVVLILLRFLEPYLLPHRSSVVQHMCIEVASVAGPFIGEVYDICVRVGVAIETLEVHRKHDLDTLEVVCSVPDVLTLVQAISELHALPGVQAIHADLPSLKGTILPNGKT